MHAAASSADSASAIENVHSLLSSRGVEARATEKNDDSGNHFILTNCEAMNYTSTNNVTMTA